MLDYLESLGENKEVSLMQLTWKAVMLLALTRPSRNADLSNLDISKRVYLPEGIKIIPVTLAKQSRQGKNINGFFFPSFPENKKLWPVETLRAYEARTAPIRGEISKLFLATIKPHKAVTSSTNARWLKRLLEGAAIDTKIFSAHSVQGASSSTASNMGITTGDILQSADWSSSSVFGRFYYKPIHDPSYRRAVLGFS